MKGGGARAAPMNVGDATKRTADVAEIVDPAMELAERGLAALAGFAPSAVLRGRLRRHPGLLANLPAIPFADDPAWAALLDAVTVQETRLFRAPAQMAALGDALPSAGGTEPLRMLSAGCATGEEAWTLAVLAAAAGRQAEVTGLDLCRTALAAAAAGVYGPGPPDPMRDVPDAHRGAFDDDGGRVRLRPVAGVGVTFRRANLLALPDDLPSYDVVLCRNVLIYLLPAARDATLRNLLRRLRPGGLLVLGPTDGVPGGAEPPPRHAPTRASAPDGPLSGTTDRSPVGQPSVPQIPTLQPVDRVRAIWRRA